MLQRTIGDTRVGSIGLGAMNLSMGERAPAEPEAIAVIHAALEAGVTLIDTADAYAPGPDVGHNERLVAKALSTFGGDTSQVLVATKGGHTRTADGGWGLDGSAGYLRRACEASLTALGVEAIGLYQHHRPDPEVPYEETLGALRDLRDAGKIRMVGISNADPERIRMAQRILGPGGLAAVQNEYSPRFRSSQGELDYCGEQGIAFLPWAPLGGLRDAGQLGSRHAAFARIAGEHGVSPQQVCLAWMLAQGEHVIPIPGSSRAETVLASVSAVDLVLSAEELRQLDESDLV